MDLTHFRPQPLTPYLIGILAKGVGVTKRVQRLAFSAIPHWYFGEECGCGERCPEATLASRPPFSPLDLTHFRPQPLTLYLIGIVAKGVGAAKGVHRLGWLRGPHFRPQPLAPYLIGILAMCPEARLASRPPFSPLDLTHFRLQPLASYLIGILAKGVGVAKAPQLGLNSFSPPALDAVGFAAPIFASGLTHFRPQPLAPYLIGILAKGVGAAKGVQRLAPYLIGILAKGVGAAKGVQRLGWLRGPLFRLWTNTFSPPALSAVPHWYFGEGCGCGERCPEARLASRPPFCLWTHFRPQPLAPYLIGILTKGVGAAKGVQRLAPIFASGLNSFSPPALDAVPDWYCGEGCRCGERCPEARLASRPPFLPLDLTHFRPQPLAPYLIGILAKGVGAVKGIRRLGWLRGPHFRLWT
uniref:Uncharacterized protein n=1 Tax=Oryza meridionalis TaxID=40149 RepID=A0A0E0C3D4_9ORYZ